MGIDVPEFLAFLGMAKDDTEMVKAVGDYALTELFYFLQVGKYIVKWKGNNSNQTVQFKLEDEIVFCQDTKGRLHQLPINAHNE